MSQQLREYSSRNKLADVLCLIYSLIFVIIVKCIYLLTYTFIHFFTHTFIEHLVCARHYSRSVDTAMKKADKQMLAFLGFLVQEQTIDNKNM